MWDYGKSTCTAGAIGVERDNLPSAPLQAVIKLHFFLTLKDSIEGFFFNFKVIAAYI